MFWILAVLPLVLGYTVYIAEVCRHGARSPWVYSPWDNDGRWPGEGQITPSGLRMHYLMGHELRNRFIISEQFLSDNYKDGEVYAYSTDYNRTIMSAQSQLLGLYPAGTGPQIDLEVTKKAVPPIFVKNLSEITEKLGNSALPNRTQVIPIHSEATEESAILDCLSGTCQRLNLLIADRTDDPELAKIYNKYSDVISVIGSYLNITNTAAIEQSNAVWDSLYSNRFHGYEVPEVFRDDELYSRMSSMILEVYKYLYYTDPDQLRLQTSPLLRDIVDYMNLAKLQQTHRKFTLYSAHDTTVMPVLTSLNVTLDSWADYASNIFFILSYENDAGFQVTVYYNDVPVVIKECQVSPCPFDKFTELIYNWSYSNLTEACMSNLLIETQSFSFSEDSSAFSGTSYVGIAVGICLVGLIALIYILRSKRDKFISFKNEVSSREVPL